jgi:hypothetical protein
MDHLKTTTDGCSEESKRKWKKGPNKIKNIRMNKIFGLLCASKIIDLGYLNLSPEGAPV